MAGVIGSAGHGSLGTVVEQSAIGCPFRRVSGYRLRVSQ
jgi:hypothetical protein